MWRPKENKAKFYRIMSHVMPIAFFIIGLLQMKILGGKLGQFALGYCLIGAVLSIFLFRHLAKIANTKNNE